MDQIVGIYRPFKMLSNISRLAHFKSQITVITNFLDTSKRVLVCGDFNLDYNKRNIQNYAQSRLYDEWIEATVAFDLVQLIKEDTWVRTCQGQVRTSLLDHAYTNVEQVIEETDVNKLEISNHSLKLLIQKVK